MKNNKRKIEKKLNRRLAIDAGFYDGRFKTKIIQDKRKKLNKIICRIKVEI